MAITIHEYGPEHQSQVQLFNDRMRANKVVFSLPSSPISGWLPKLPGRSVILEFWLALEGETVRGGYKLRHQRFILNGTEVSAANYQGPLSEGVYDRNYALVGVQLLRSALRKQPLLYALGMGGVDQPLPKILKASGWSMALVPFLFKVVRPSAFLRNIRPLRRSPFRRIAMDLAAMSGAGVLGFGLLNSFRKKKSLSRDIQCVSVPSFGSWTDEIWNAAKALYLFAGIRDQTSQNIIFSEENSKNIKLCVSKNGKPIGWAVVRCTPMNDDKYFGNLILGSIVDCMAIPSCEFDVVESAGQFLAKAGADLIMTNQTHRAWIEALKNAAYLSGPSNFAFACSPKLAEQLGPFPEGFDRIHFNRSDGDGPIHI
jgi:hypothetical protein